MARRPNGFTLGEAEVKILNEMFADDAEVMRDKMRDHVRELFDDAIEEHRHFEQALVAVFSAGMQAAMKAKPKRTRKPKAQAGADAEP